MTECFLCCSLRTNDGFINLSKENNENNSIQDLIEIYLPFYDISSENVQSSIVCLDCNTQLRNFHNFYQKIHKFYTKRVLDCKKIHENQNSFENYEELYLETFPTTLSDDNQVDDQNERQNKNQNNQNAIKINQNDEICEFSDNQNNFSPRTTNLEQAEMKIHEELSIERLDHSEINSSLLGKDSPSEINEILSQNNEIPSKFNKTSSNKFRDPSKSQQTTRKVTIRNSERRKITKIPKSLAKTPPVKKTIQQLIKADSNLADFIAMKCDLCNENLNSFENAISHHKSVHNQQGYLICCARKFKQRSILINHLELHQNPEKFQCTICDKKLTSMNNLKMHVNMSHKSVTQLQCDICGKKMKSKYRVTAHMKDFHMKIEKSAILVCKKCPKTFKTRTRLEKHEKVHESPKCESFWCEVCGKELKTMTSLRDHMKIAHSEPTERIKCNLCGHYLKNVFSMRKHMNRHRQMEQNIKCDVCSKPCTTKVALRSHMRMKHLLERIIPCRFCTKKFKQNIDRDEHESTHTGVDLYSCQWCSATFKFGANFRAHRKKFHPDEYEKIKPKWLRPN